MSEKVQTNQHTSHALKRVEKIRFILKMRVTVQREKLYPPGISAEIGRAPTPKQRPPKTGTFLKMGIFKFHCAGQPVSRSPESALQGHNKPL